MKWINRIFGHFWRLNLEVTGYVFLCRSFAIPVRCCLLFVVRGCCSCTEPYPVHTEDSRAAFWEPLIHDHLRSSQFWFSLSELIPLNTKKKLTAHLFQSNHFHSCFKLTSFRVKILLLLSIWIEKFSIFPSIKRGGDRRFSVIFFC